jgi:hypothetical protein
MVFDHVNDFLERIDPLETVVAEGTCQLAAHLGVLGHRDYEMRLAFWRSLGHHGGTRCRILDLSETHHDAGETCHNFTAPHLCGKPGK